MMVAFRNIFSILTTSMVILTFACGQDDPKNAQDCSQVFPPSYILITSHSEWTRIHYPDRLEEFKNDLIESGDIVMIGNSLTEQCQDWSLKLGLSNIKNRGISGDNTDGVLARLDEIICGNPSVIFLMIGTNDLWTEYSIEKISENIDLIGRQLVSQLPSAKIFVQTVMPLAASNEKVGKVNDINSLLRVLVDTPYFLIDTNREMADNQGYLLSEFTNDGVHLTAKGYEHWSNFLKQILNEY